MKKYLNSVKEVVKALKEGKKVTCYNDGSIYQIIDEFLIEDQQDKGTAINSHIYFNEKYKYYTEEAEPLKFEVNRAYETRNGLKAFLDCKVDDGFNFILRDDDYCTDLDGKYYKNQEHRNDIVGYWEEEK